MSNLDSSLMSRIMYSSFCTEEEIDRILSPKNAVDFLLQKRADIVADHMRFLRVYMNKVRVTPNWSLEKSFVNNHYTEVYSNLSLDDQDCCRDIIYGDIFSNDVNGYIVKYPKWGRIIHLDESLRYFMTFCNLSLLNFSEAVPDKVRFNSLRIAIRIMFKQEAMDFFMDPRGIISKNIGFRIHESKKHELEFIAGHEFSHHLCGHLNEDDISEKSMLSLDGYEYTQSIYNTQQKQEFEADLASINRPRYRSDKYNKILEASLLWFMSLELGELAVNTLCPKSYYAINTHPTATDRFKNIIENAKIPEDFNMNKVVKIQKNLKKLKVFLEEDLSVNCDLYETYGSAYLDAPNTKWRGKALIDRVDYY